MHTEQASKTILVIGGCGHGGSKIVKGLIEKTTFSVLVVGRNARKLASLSEEFASARLKTEVLDANDREKLSLCCRKVDMVINASGPFSLGGDEIVKTIVSCKIPYVDIANEQLHLINLRQMKTQIETSGSMVFTCTGQSPGVSTLMMTHIAKMTDKVDSIEMYGVVGRLPTPDQGLASMMSGIIEAAMGSTTYIDGKHVQERLGKFTKKHTMPLPFGEMNMLSVPQNDSILVPEAVECKSVRTLFGLEKEFPPMLFLVMSWLKPHKRKWVYNLLEKIVMKSLKDNYKIGLKEGFTPGGYMKIVVKGSKNIEALIKIEDNAVMVSYMPIVIAINYFENPEKFKGLLTPNDIYTFDSFNSELDKLGWKIDLNVQTIDSNKQVI